MGVADGTGTAVDVGVSGCVQARTKTSTGELPSRNSLLVIASLLMGIFFLVIGTLVTTGHWLLRTIWSSGASGSHSPPHLYVNLPNGQFWKIQEDGHHPLIYLSGNLRHLVAPDRKRPRGGPGLFKGRPPFSVRYPSITLWTG